MTVACCARVQAAQGRVLAEAGDYARAEAMLLKAKRADLAIKMYRELRKWEDALRVADEYMPTKVRGVLRVWKLHKPQNLVEYFGIK